MYHQKARGHVAILWKAAAWQIAQRGVAERRLIVWKVFTPRYMLGASELPCGRRKL